MSKSKSLQRELAKNSLGWFCQLYLKHYITSGTPDFHWAIYADLENEQEPYILLNAFRDSAKSTLASLGLPLYAAVTGRYKFIIICSDTATQAKQHIANLIHELENNQALLEDFGPFKGTDEWTKTSVILKNKTQILSRSRGQKVRGLRHLQYRPDLIIGDDVENTESVRTKEQRDKTSEWWLANVWPALDKKRGKLLLLGNLIHLDSLIARQKKLILKEGLGIVKEYRIMDKHGNSVWPERFSEQDIADLKKRDNRFFLREYMLKVIPDAGQVIKKVHYYTELPKLSAIAIAVDPAISKKATADYTAINTMGQGEDGGFYNLDNIAGRWDMNEALPIINDIYVRYSNAYPEVPIFLGFEDVAFQRALIEEYTRRYFITPEAITPTKDKRARLATHEPYFTSGGIKFREQGDEDVVIETLGFGIEQHDDRIDSLLMSFDLLLNQVRPDIIAL